MLVVGVQHAWKQFLEFQARKGRFMGRTLYLVIDKYRWTVTDRALEAAAMRDKDTADVFTSYAATLPHRNS